MPEAAATQRYTYDDLAGFPDDNHRREIIGGQLIVTPALVARGQQLTTPVAPGFAVAVDDVLGPPR